MKIKLKLHIHIHTSTRWYIIYRRTKFFLRFSTFFFSPVVKLVVSTHIRIAHYLLTFGFSGFYDKIIIKCTSFECNRTHPLPRSRQFDLYYFLREKILRRYRFFFFFFASRFCFVYYFFCNVSVWKEWIPKTDSYVKNGVRNKFFFVIAINLK